MTQADSSAIFLLMVSIGVGAKAPSAAAKAEIDSAPQPSEKLGQEKTCLRGCSSPVPSGDSLLCYDREAPLGCEPHANG